MSNITIQKELIPILEQFVSDPLLVELESKLKIFNILEIFKIKHFEISISAFLAWVLDPSGSHGLDDYFLRYFLIHSVKNNEEIIRKANKTEKIGIIQIDLLKLTDATVKTEESFRDKKADITIKALQDKFLCLIENKVKAKEGDDQTTNYAKLSKEKYRDFKYLYIFLTPHESEANSDEFINITYSEIRDLLNQSLKAKKDVINDEVRFLLEQFVQNIEVNILEESEIQKLCQEIYQRHKKAIDTIINYKPDYIAKIKFYIENLLNDEWDFYTTKRVCLIFRKAWIIDFKEFLSPNFPILHYEVNSWEQDGLHISVEVHLEEDKKKGGKFGIRDKMATILKNKFDKNNPKSYSYRKNRSLVKFKDIILEDGYETEEDLNFVANEMKKLIDETQDTIEESLDLFKKTYKEELPNWKRQLND